MSRIPWPGVAGNTLITTVLINTVYVHIRQIYSYKQIWYRQFCMCAIHKKTICFSFHFSCKVKMYRNPITGLDRPGGFQEAEAHTLQDSRHMKLVRLSALRTGHLYTPGNIPGTDFCQRLSQHQMHCAAGRLMSMKNSNDTVGNRTRDLPACRAVPQRTALPLAPFL